jgi:hypothetical protein
MKTVNIWAVIVSAVGSTAFGFLWFMVLFREPYIKGLGRTQEQLNLGPNGATATIYQLVGNLIMIYVLGWLMTNTAYETVGQGIKLALLLWVAFVACVIGPMYAFEAFPFYFFLITTGYVLVSLLISGAVLGAWKS